MLEPATSMAQLSHEAIARRHVRINSFMIKFGLKDCLDLIINL